MSSHGEKLQKQIFISSCFRRHFGSKITHTCSSGVSLFFSELKSGKASWEGFENGKIKLERGRQSEFPTVRHFVTSLQTEIAILRVFNDIFIAIWIGRKLHSLHCLIYLRRLTQLTMVFFCIDLRLLFSLKAKEMAKMRFLAICIDQK